MIRTPLQGLPPARRILETGGPTILPIGAIPDTQFMKRSGPSIVGGPSGGGGGVGSAIVDELRGYGLTQVIVSTMDMNSLSESSLIQLGTLGAITFTKSEESVLLQVGNNLVNTTVGWRYSLPFPANRVFVSFGYEHNSSSTNDFRLVLIRSADGHFAYFGHLQNTPNYRYLKDVGAGTVLVQNYGSAPAENSRGMMSVFWARGKFAYAWDGNQEGDFRRRFLRDALVRNVDTGPANPIDTVDITFNKADIDALVRSSRVHGPLIVAIGP
ncbi:MAG: hypothetical protein ACRER2_13845 [Methylococcales bacterium]